MIWQLDRQKISATLDEPMAKQLTKYLEKKESMLGVQVVGAIHSGAPSIPIKNIGQAVERFEKKIQFAIESKCEIDPTEWQSTVKQVNDSLWSYIEILESCVNEFFLQIDQIGFEQWNQSIVETAKGIRSSLLHRMEDLIWAIRRLEEQLKNYKQACKKSHAPLTKLAVQFFVFKRHLLDPTFETTIRKCQKFLNFRYQQFVENFKGYVELYHLAELSSNDFSNFRVFSSLESDAQEKFKHFYLLLKIWDLNKQAKTLPRSESIRALRTAGGPEYILEMLQRYASEIRKGLFDKSRLIKSYFNLEKPLDPEIKMRVLDSAISYQNELQMLGITSSIYRKFLLDTDPNSYLRINWREGIWKWFSGRETNNSKQLRLLNGKIDQLRQLCESFRSSLECKKEAQTIVPQLENEINQHLHEMGQPLASKELMKRHAKALLSISEEMDEIGTSNPEVVKCVCKVLSKAIRADWKYHVLFDLPLFRKIYECHREIVFFVEERPHFKRLNSFRKILDQLQGWIKSKETLKHHYEIELDINDIKSFLQDFYAELQRLQNQEQDKINKEEFHIITYRMQELLLDYLYLFGKFFHQIRLEESEARLIRRQLLFVNQYFDAIAGKIQELDSL